MRRRAHARRAGHHTPELPAAIHRHCRDDWSFRPRAERHYTAAQYDKKLDEDTRVALATRGSRVRPQISDFFS